MCGRYTLRASPDALRSHFRLAPTSPLQLRPRYNIAPSDVVPAVIQRRGADPELTLVQWGLLPSWAKPPLRPAINARVETAVHKPSFRAAIKRRRCLIPANGFYEWSGKGKARLPHLVEPGRGGLVALAGIWEVWQGPEGGEIPTCAILTTDASGPVRALYDRMPVVVPAELYTAWLDPESPLEALLAQAVSHTREGLQWQEHPVSTLVNNPRNDVPECLEPAANTNLELFPNG